MTVPIIAPEYSVLLVATATGQVVDSVNWSDFTFDDTLAWASPGNMTVTVPLLGEAQMGALSLPSLRSIRQDGQGYSLCLVREQRALFAGPCVAMTWDEATAQIGCSSLGKFFDGRMVINPAYLATPLTAPNVHLTADLPDRAIALMASAVIGAGRGLPLVLPAQSGNSGPGVDYVAADLGTVYDRISEAATAADGPDVFISPVLSTDQQSLQWVVNVGLPRLGSTTPSAVFDLSSGVDTISGTDDYTQMVTTGYLPGDVSGESGTRLMGVATIPTTGARVAFERADRTSVSNTSQGALDGLVTSYVDVNSDPVQTWTVNLFVDQHPLYLDEWAVGDIVELGSVTHPLLEDGEYLRRVVGITGHTPTTVGLVTTDVPAGMLGS